MFSKKCFNNSINNIKNSKIIYKTLLEKNKRLSEKYNCNVFFKREDLQNTRSFKIRGAYNKIKKTTENNKNINIVTASAGNHAQGVSITCNYLKIKHDIFLPKITPLQKINRIKYFGNKYLTLHLIGNDFDECLNAASEYCNNNKSIFIHPFDDEDVIFGQATIGYEIYEDINPHIIIIPIGGGGLISGIGKYSKIKNPKCLIYGIEPSGADSMNVSIKKNKIKTLKNIDTFVDGASVKKVGEKTFNISRNVIDNIYIINNNQLSYTMIDIYQNEGIVLEPAGALSIASLDNIDKSILKNKNIVCILSGGNNDISRYPDILEKSLLHQNLKHYFLINFGQIPGQLNKFINNVLGKYDDITRFEYLKKNNKNYGAVLIGIELQNKNDIEKIIFNMEKYNFNFTKISEKDLLYSYLI